MARAIENIPYHCFNMHDKCGTWYSYHAKSGKLCTTFYRKVSGLPLYLRAGVILHHRADGILQSNPHLIE